MIEPKLRFKADDGSQFPDWEKKKLEDVVEFLDGQRKPLEAGQRVSGKYPYYGASGIIDYVEDYIFDEELILLSEDGANILDRNYRVCFLAKGKYWVNNHAHVLRAMDGNVNGFICEQLETFDYRKYNSGGAQPKLNQATCRAIIMNMPSIPEQQKIVEFLSTIDTVIEKQKETVATWEERKKGVMQKLFSQEVRFKADDGSDFPDWDEKTLSEIASIHARIGWQNLRKDEFLTDGNYLLITGTDFCNGRVNFSTCYYVDKERYEQDKNIQVENGTILVTKDGTLGKVALVENLNKPATLNAGVFAIKVIHADTISKFLYHWLAAPMLLEYASKKSTGGTIKHLNQGILVDFPVGVPCIAEQRKIADCLSSLDEVIEKQKATLAAWEELKKGLLQQMFV